MDEIKVILVDDHTLLRSGLKLMLELEHDINVVAEAQTAVQAISLTQELEPDVVLLDLTMPGMSGLDAIRSLREVSPTSQILILTMHDDESYLRSALSAGAGGYILKKAADEELLAAIRAVARGELYIHSTLTRSLLNGIVPSRVPHPTEMENTWESLSNREQEVLKLVAFGHTSAEVAERLSLSAKTIETYRARGMEKLGLRSRAALVKYAMAMGLFHE
jgi:two-component system response regulator NreC